MRTPPHPALRAVLIDSDPNSRQALCRLFHDFCPQIEVAGEADSVPSGYQLLRKAQPDAVFLNVCLANGTGFDLLRKFSNPSFQVVCTSVSEAFAAKAYRFNAVDYLLKPVDIDELLRAVRKLERSIPAPVTSSLQREESLAVQMVSFNKIVLSTQDGVHFIDLKDIVHLEADAGYTTLFLQSGEKVTVAKTLKSFEGLLPAQMFYRPHQSHIINLVFIKKILQGDGGCLLMKGDCKVPLARSKKVAFLSLCRHRFL